MKKLIGLVFLPVAVLAIALQPNAVQADTDVATAPAVVIRGSFCFFSDMGMSSHDVFTASSNDNRNFTCRGQTSTPPAATFQSKATCFFGGRVSHNAHLTITKSGRVSVQCHFNG